MFYPTERFVEKTKSLSSTELKRGIVVLTPSESKRLLAKAVAALPEVKNALKNGNIIIALGTTDAYCAEELTGEKLDKQKYVAGYIYKGLLSVLDSQKRILAYTLVKGKRSELQAEALLKEFGADDVYIKGGSAVDPEGNAGVLAAGEAGGTIGGAWPVTSARGSYLIMPVGLEKLIPSVTRAFWKCGQKRIDRFMGKVPLALIPVTTGLVVTEIEAIEVLTGAVATHIASGGIGGSEGAVVLQIEGDQKTFDEAFALVESIKGEPSLPSPE